MIILGIFLFVVGTDAVLTEEDASIKCLHHVGNQFNYHRQQKSIFQIIHESANFQHCSGIFTPNSHILQEIRAYCPEIYIGGNKSLLPNTKYQRTRTACLNLFWPPEFDYHGNPRCINVAFTYTESAGDALDKGETTRNQVKQYLHVFPENVRNCIIQQCEVLSPLNPERLAAPGKLHACRAILSNND